MTPAERLKKMPASPHGRVEWFRQLIESTAEPISIVSVGSGRFVDTNAAFIRTMGFEPQEIIGRTPSEIGFLRDLAAYDRLLAASSAESINELDFRTRGGQWRCAQISRMAIEVAGQACLIVIWRDITERKQFELDMARARDLALESARLKSDFLATVSHELRTPLNGIIGMSELLSETALTPEQREFADTIGRSSAVLLKLVNDILDFSKGLSGQLRFEHISFDLRTVVESAIAMYATLAKGKGLELTWSIDPAIPQHLIGDPHRLGEVLTNLLNNAIKFTESGAITVRVALEKARDESAAVVLFQVHDTGIGISPTDLERVFRPFIQADGSTTRRYGGTGLGLAICRSLVDLMQGNIGVDSKLGLGSTFHFTARFAQAQIDSGPRAPDAPERIPQMAPGAIHDAVPAAVPGPQPDRARVRVLIVEDNPLNQTVLQRQLENLGYRNVGKAANGFEALAALTAEPYDIVLMDCEMPLMDGREATVQIRERERARGWKHSVVIAVTAYAMTDDQEKCLACGMDDYLSKPIRIEDLTRVLDRWSQGIEDAVATSAS
jgi:PAS domain S-box-containing protein